MLKKIIFSLAMLVAMPAAAVDVQQVETKEGFKAYFVQSSTLPMVSVQLSFRAGSAFEEEGKQGVAALTASLMDEGAGDMNAEEFTQEVQNIGARLGASAGMLDFNVSLTTLSVHKERAFELLKEMLLKPRFDKADFERLQKSMVSSLKSSQQKPSNLLSQEFAKQYYGTHPYGRFETVASVNGLTLNDVRAYYAKQINKKNLVISVVGDIEKGELIAYLDDVLEDLPAGYARNKIEQTPPVPTAKLVRVHKNIPQTHVKMGHKGIGRHDADYFTAYIMNYVLGGGGFNSRLMEEVREKRGLAYSVYSYFEPMPIYGRFIAAVQTKNKDADTSIYLMKKEMKRMKNGEMSEKELQIAKQYLVGSFPLRLNTNRKILGYLTAMQTEGLGPDYLDTWAEKIEAVKLEDIQRAASRLFQPENLVVVTLGGDK